MLRCFGLIALSLALAPAAAAQDAATRLVYFGTYTSKGSEGIYVAALDCNTGKLGAPQLAAKVTNPSFLALHPNSQWLYAVSEVDSVDGKKGGGISAFSIDKTTGLLTKMNAQWTGGGAPCHLSIDR